MPDARPAASGQRMLAAGHRHAADRGNRIADRPVRVEGVDGHDGAGRPAEVGGRGHRDPVPGRAGPGPDDLVRGAAGLAAGARLVDPRVADGDRERDRVGPREPFRGRALPRGERRRAGKPGGRGRGAAAPGRRLARYVGPGALGHAAAPGQGASGERHDGRARENRPRRSMLAHVAASLWGVALAASST